jgi:SNF2-related domain
MAPEFQSKILSRRTTPDEYRVYRAALEWDLTDPIVIEGRDDFRSAKRWQERLTPYYHQVSNLITFCRRLPVTLLADDVGLGKTISAGLIVSELMSRSRVSKILIVAPKLLGPQWKEELEAKFNIPAEIAIGKDLVRSDPDGVGAVITTYNTARLYLDALPEDRFQMLILDEAHKLRNLYGVEKTPQVAKRFHKALEDRRFRFVLMLTATPIQNRLWDLYSLVDLLSVARGHTNPFGTEGSFARRFIADQRQHARQLRAERALKSLFVTSSLSQTRILEDPAIRSSRGTYCLPTEAQPCFWTGRKSHPDDLRVCELTGLPIHFEHATGDHAPRLRSLAEMLDGIRRTTDETQLWDSVAPRIAAAVKGAKCRVEAATLSPTKMYLATCSEASTLMGIRVRQVGAVYDLNDTAIVGRLAVGKRGPSGWTAR